MPGCISCKFHAEEVTLTKSPVREENNSRSIELNEITVIFYLFKSILTPIRKENFSSTPKIFGPT